MALVEFDFELQSRVVICLAVPLATKESLARFAPLVSCLGCLIGTGKRGGPIRNWIRLETGSDCTQLVPGLIVAG